MSDLLCLELLRAGCPIVGRLYPGTPPFDDVFPLIPTPFAVPRVPSAPVWLAGASHPSPSADVRRGLEPWWRLIYRSSDRTFGGQAVDVALLENIGFRLAAWAEQQLLFLKPDVVLWPVFPHTMPDLAFLLVAAAMGIRNLVFESTVNSTTNWLIDPMIRLTSPGNALASVVNPVRSVGQEEIDRELLWDGNPPPLEADRRRRAEAGRSFDAATMGSLLYHALLGGSQRLSRYPTTGQISRLMHYSSYRQRRGRIRRFRDRSAYDELCSRDAPDQGYILVALHDEPERVVVPGCFPTMSQSLMMGMVLEAASKHGCPVVVKEHPSHFALNRASGWRRTEEWYRQLEQESQVPLFFAGTNRPSQELIGGAACVVTGTGTIGWEAVRSSAKVACFGTPFYAHPLGASFFDSANALESILCTDLPRSNAACTQTIARDVLGHSRCGLTENSPDLVRMLGIQRVAVLVSQSADLVMQTIRE